MPVPIDNGSRPRPRPRPQPRPTRPNPTGDDAPRPRPNPPRIPPRNGSPRNSGITAMTGFDDPNGTTAGYNVGNIYADWAGRNSATQMPAPTLGGGDGGGGGGYGGGGGGNIQAQIDFFTSLLAGGAMNPTLQQYTPDDALSRALSGAVGEDRLAANQSYDALDAYMQKNLGNAYSGAQAQQVNPVEDLAGLASSQGVNPSAVQGGAYAVNSAGRQQQDAAQQLLQNLGLATEQSNESRMLQSQQDRTFADRQISASQTGLQAALARQESQRRDQINASNLQATQAAQQARIQIASQLAALIGQYGGQMPDLSALGL